MKSEATDRKYAVIDTNVVVSAMYTHNPDSPTKLVIEAVLQGRVIPLISEEIIAEYREVLSRKEFPFNTEDINNIINAFVRFGVNPGRKRILMESFPDHDDVVFYEVALSKSGSFVVTGNKKHFPVKPFVVSPAEFMEILL